MSYTVTGLVQALYVSNLEGRRRDFRQAIRLNPSRSEARTGYAFSVLLPARRMHEAIEELKEAVKWEPGLDHHQSSCWHTGIMRAAIMPRRSRQCDATLDLDPAYARAHATASLPWLSMATCGGLQAKRRWH